MDLQYMYNLIDQVHRLHRFDYFFFCRYRQVNQQGSCCMLNSRIHRKGEQPEKSKENRVCAKGREEDVSSEVSALHSTRLFCSGVPVSTTRRRVLILFIVTDSAVVLFFNT